jgi:hypothetical protein
MIERGKDMYSQVKSKKAVSVIIGYVLLVSFAVVIGLIVFQWMKTYVPQEDLNCPDGVSIFIENYTCSGNSLEITLKNNGKFSIGGYFIYATNSPEQELATIDLSKNNTKSSSRIGNVIKLGAMTPRNAFEANNESVEKYDITGITKIYSIEILPVRWQTEKNRNILVSCKDVEIKETIECN